MFEMIERAARIFPSRQRSDAEPSAGTAVAGSWEEAVLWLRAQPGQRELVEAAYYDDPLHAAAERYWASAEWAEIRRRLPAQGQVLDVGAGRGIASYAFAKDGYRTTALEPDASAIVGAEAIRGLARESGLAIEVVQLWSEQLPFPAHSFDIVFARASLHHARDLRAACREFYRVLKPGGLLLAVREHVLSSHGQLEAFLEQHPLHHRYGGEHAYLLAEYTAALESAGLRLEEVLAPLECAINYGPRSLLSLQQELAQRLCDKLRLGALSELLVRGLQTPGTWSRLQPLLARIDHRPGRLYSFAASKRAVPPSASEERRPRS